MNSRIDIIVLSMLSAAIGVFTIIYALYPVNPLMAIVGVVLLLALAIAIVVAINRSRN